MTNSNIFSEDLLMHIAVEFLIKPLGSIIQLKNTDKNDWIKNLSNKLIKFKYKKAETRAIYFGFNDKTRNLHWLLMNKKYLQTGHQVYDNKSSSYVTEEDRKNISKDRIISDIFEKIPEVYDPYNFAEISSWPQKTLNSERAGLAMLAFRDKKPYCSSFAILDPRSYEAGKFDCKIGCETAFYLPIFKDRLDLTDPNKLPLGVLLVFFESEKRGDYISSIKIKDDKILEVKNEIATESAALGIALQEMWPRIFTERVKTGINILDTLFHTHLRAYMDYVTSFDNYVVKKSIKVINESKYLNEVLKLNSNKQGLQDLCNLKITAKDFLENFFENQNADKFPTTGYLETLKELEPLLQSMGKKDHYIHMFKTFLLGNLLLAEWITEKKRRDLYFKCWSLIAFSHDIGYPVEMMEEEIEEFFERYFHKKKIPKVLISRDLLWSYGNFAKYRLLIQEGVEDLFRNSIIADIKSREKQAKYDAQLFMDIMEYNFRNKNDHAVISALFTMKCIDVHWENKLNLSKQYSDVVSKLYRSTNNNSRKDDFLKFISVPILLHNFYQWKYFYVEELGNIQLKECFKGKEDTKLKDSCTELFAHIWDRRHYEIMSEKQINDDFDDYKDTVTGLKIPSINLQPLTRSENIRFLSFLLSITDFLQETGREQPSKISIPKGVYVTEIDGKGIKLRTPYVRTANSEGETDKMPYTKEVDGYFLKWYKSSDRSKPHFVFDEGIKGQEKYKEQKRQYEKAAQDALEEMNKSTEETNLQDSFKELLQYETAYKAFECHFKFKNAVYDTEQKFEIQWENLFEKKKDNANSVIKTDFSKA